MSTKAIELPSGNWRVRVEIKTDGKRRWKSFTAPTRKAEEYLAAQYAYTQKEQNKPQDMTIGGAMDAFIDARTSVLSPSTIRGYRQIRRCYFQDIAGMKLRDISNAYIQREVNTIARTCSPKTVRNACVLLTAALGLPPGFYRARGSAPQDQAGDCHSQQGGFAAPFDCCTVYAPGKRHSPCRWIWIEAWGNLCPTL